jgi:quercetin dioxygenase-like cupin family protein
MREAVFTDVMGSVEELQVLTDRMRVLTSGTSTGGRYELFEVIGGPGGMAPLHQHPWDEDYYVLDGALAIIVEGFRYTYGKGDALRVAAGTAHTFEVPEGGCRFLMLTSPSGAGFFFRALDDAMRTGRLTEAEVARLAAIHQVEAAPPEPKT